jgi:hypothetical protein
MLQFEFMKLYSKIVHGIREGLLYDARSDSTPFNNRPPVVCKVDLAVICTKHITAYLKSCSYPTSWQSLFFYSLYLQPSDVGINGAEGITERRLLG